MHPALESLHEIARLNHRLFLNCLDDVDESTWIRLLEGNKNNIAFLFLHSLGARQYLAKTMGVEVDLPILAELEGGNDASDMKTVPTIDDAKAAWNKMGDVLGKAFEATSDDQLAVDIAAPFPTGNTTVLGALNFLMAHESYHLGQLAYLRRCFGLEAMKYT